MDKRNPPNWREKVARFIGWRPIEDTKPAPPPQIDREEERRRAPPPRSSAPHIPTAFYTGERTAPRSASPASARPDFQRHSLSEDIKKRQEFDRRFKSDQAREAAQKVMDEAAKQWEKNFDRFKKAAERINSDIKHYASDRRPVPPELGKHLNETFLNAKESYEREAKEISQHLERGLTHAATLDLRDPKTITPKSRRITHQPAQSLDDIFDESAKRRSPYHQDAAAPDSSKPEAPSPPPTPAAPTQSEPADWVAHFRRANGHSPPPPSPGFDR